ncbi:peptidoglycan DD-metalloendopeptidase family protein [Proteinivorax tanatarense]|uniref:Peptidoglycan DD-metalloendopeptidase family protein n=1 Tax=Proteinivorax tanatarense TaxID=1260629 RepID=A0AAU7VQI5_9FIRM
MNKQRNKFTFLFFQNNITKPLKIDLSLIAIQCIGIIILIVLIGFIAFFAKYIEMAAYMNELHHLRTVNYDKNIEIERLVQQTETILDELESVNEFKTQVNQYSNIELEQQKKQKQDSTLYTESRGATLIDRAHSSLVFLNNSLSSNQEIMENMVDDIKEEQRRQQEIEKRLAHTPSIRPTTGRVTSPFGYRRNPVTGGRQHHTGVDLANSAGTPILATANGVVASASYAGAYGNLIIIDHGYGYSTYYAHLSRISVRPGQTVGKGEVIGFMGRTGRATGNHLHYEVRVNGSPVNPASYY